MAKLNVKAADLKRELFELVGSYKALAQSCASDAEAYSQADEAACNLARVYESLGDLFLDAYRDPKDQSFAAEITTA